MKTLADGETAEIKGSGKKPYVLRNIGGVYDCSCVAWKMQSHAIDTRTCKHLVGLLGVDAELGRVGLDNLPTAVKKKLGKDSAAVSTKVPSKPAKKGEPKALKFVFDYVVGAQHFKGATFIQNNNYATGAPDHPTDDRPGTPAKLATMGRRAAAGLPRCRADDGPALDLE